MEAPIQPEPLSNDNIERVLADLDSATNHLPIAAILVIRQHRAQFIPRLIEELRRGTTDALHDDPPQENGPFFAMLLLTEFRALEAWPAMKEAISLPGELPFDLFDDLIMTLLPRILVDMVGDRLDELDALIGNRDLNEFVRWEAVKAYVLLVLGNRMTRAEVVERLRQHLQAAIDNRDYDIAGPLVSELTGLIGVAARAEIDAAFEHDFAGDITDLEYVEEVFSNPEADFRSGLSYYVVGPIDDVIAELEDWDSFNPKRAARGSDSDADRFDADIDDFFDGFEDDDEDAYDEFDSEGDGDDEGERSWPLRPAGSDLRPILDEMAARPEEDYEGGTIRRTAARVGRNDPCPCGSGKKFKKCCGAAK